MRAGLGDDVVELAACAETTTSASPPLAASGAGTATHRHATSSAPTTPMRRPLRSAGRVGFGADRVVGLRRLRRGAAA